MRFLLDSNIVIAATLAVSEPLRARLAACDADDLVISSIVYAEVLFGSSRGMPPVIDRLRIFVEEVPVLDFDMAAAVAYASIPHKRASYDRLIAAHALSLGLCLITDNTSDFTDVPGLKVENWMVELPMRPDAA